LTLIFVTVRYLELHFQNRTFQSLSEMDLVKTLFYYSKLMHTITRWRKEVPSSAVYSTLAQQAGMPP